LVIGKQKHARLKFLAFYKRFLKGKSPRIKTRYRNVLEQYLVQCHLLLFLFFVSVFLTLVETLLIIHLSLGVTVRNSVNRLALRLIRQNTFYVDAVGGVFDSEKMFDSIDVKTLEP
jgi:hypothetical protein